MVVGFICLLLLLQLASRTFIHPSNDTTYLAGHVDGQVCTISLKILRCIARALPSLYSYAQPFLLR